MERIVKAVEILVRNLLKDTINTVKETLAAADRVLVPRCRGAVIAHEEDVSTECICTVFVCNIQRIHNVAFGFAHLGTIRSENQTLCGTFCVWFRCVDNTDIIQETMPETGIDHMSCNMFHTAVVPVNRHPVFQLLRICQCFCVVRIDITQEIP